MYGRDHRQQVTVLTRGGGFRINCTVLTGVLECVAGPSAEAWPYKLGCVGAAGAQGALRPGWWSSSESDWMPRTMWGWPW